MADWYSKSECVQRDIYHRRQSLQTISEGAEMNKLTITLLICWFLMALLIVAVQVVMGSLVPVVPARERFGLLMIQVGIGLIGTGVLLTFIDWEAT